MTTTVPDGDFPTHAQTYHRFMLGVKWLSLHLAAILVLLVLGFATPAGFGWGLIAGIAVFAIGAFALTHGLDRSTESDPFQVHGPDD